MDKQVEDLEFYTKTTEMVKVVTIEPKVDKLRNEVIEYFNTNTIGGHSYKFNDLKKNKDYAGRTVYDLDFDWVDEDNEIHCIDEDFESDKAFDAFLKDISERYQTKVDFPYWYLPK
ncbi:MAG: hypothetical protein JXR12_06405 [Neptunomonas phycophila]|uniref:hypothetical protein n=1 Tax=Neptunomonas phycophila TaxID=1572645 RepID=UPI003B8AB17F